MRRAPSSAWVHSADVATCGVSVQLTVPFHVSAGAAQKAAAHLRRLPLLPVLVFLPGLIFAVLSQIQPVPLVLGPSLRVPSLLGPEPVNERGDYRHAAGRVGAAASLLFAHGAVLHEVADLAADAAAAVIWSHLPLGENFWIKEVLLRRMEANRVYYCSLEFPSSHMHKHAATDHQTGVDRRKGFDGRSKHSSAVDEGLHDEVGHCRERRGNEKYYKQ